ncbi:MAG: FABP family protein [Candidatus Palauibacterales bacterium]|nr:FABP family protein [Candidatus Palauibacterales bacterium]MDP2585010.1 FABP family protein [Candidatus Palauibacterales bacterium]
MTVRLDDFLHLVGTWEGRGHAEYPTIDATDYREELVFEHDGKDPILHYVQKTWKPSGSGRMDEPIFWESGFLIDRDDGVFELVSAQKSGRVEVLRGSAVRGEDGAIALDLESVWIVNDDRVLASVRRLVIAPDRFDYRLEMSLRTHPAVRLHLAARLVRADLP